MNTFHLTPEHEAELLAFLLSTEPIEAPPKPATRITPVTPGPRACTRCAGIGRIVAYAHVANGVCFRCGGSRLEP